MFQPHPKPFSCFYPTYLVPRFEEDGDNGLRDDLDNLDNLGNLESSQVAGFCNYQQTPYDLGGRVAPRGPCPGGGGEDLGGCAAHAHANAHAHAQAHAHGGAAVAGVGSTAQPTIPALFPFQQQPPPLLQPLTEQRHFSPIRSAASNIIDTMEQSQALEDELAAQEAAARTWQPELEVRLHR